MKRLEKKLERPAYVFAYAPTMVAQENYPAPEVPAALPPAAAPSVAPKQSLLASMVRPARKRAETVPEPVSTPALVPVSAPDTAQAAMPKPELLGTVPATEPPAAVPASPVATEPVVASTPSNSHREREWTPLLTATNAIR